MFKSKLLLSVTLASTLGLVACSTPTLPPSVMKGAHLTENGDYLYRIGNNDTLSVFVWNNADVSGDFPVSPDGKINMSLTGELKVTGKTPIEIEQVLTKELGNYIKSPKVTVQVKNASGTSMERIKLIGDAVSPRAIPYRNGMTLLDLMIAVGGLTQYADGNDAELMRVVNGELVTYPIKIESLIEKADLSKNVDLLPGDVIRIPEAWF